MKRHLFRILALLLLMGACGMPSSTPPQPPLEIVQENPMPIAPNTAKPLWRYEPTFGAATRVLASSSERFIGLNLSLATETPLLVVLDQNSSHVVTLTRCELIGPPDETGNAWCKEELGRDVTTATRFWRLQQPSKRLELPGRYLTFVDESGQLLVVGGKADNNAPTPAILARYAPSGELVKSVTLPMPIQLLRVGLLSPAQLFLLYDPGALGLKHAGNPPETDWQVLAYHSTDFTLSWRQREVSPALLPGHPDFSLTEQGAILLLSGTHARQLTRLRTDTGEKLSPLEQRSTYTWLRPLWSSPTSPVAYFRLEQYTGKGHQTRGWQLLSVGQDVRVLTERAEEFPPTAGIWLGGQLVLTPYADPPSMGLDGKPDVSDPVAKAWLQQLTSSAP